jgi:uncharacterized protein (DUF1800 family)
MPGLKRLLLSLAVAAGMAPSASWSITEAEAARFLTQATFGPTPSEVKHLQAIGYEAWIDEQFAIPLPALGHQAYWDQRNAALISQKNQASTDEVTASFWRLALTSQDQLRQRIAFALSEIFVVSLADNCGDIKGARGVANFLDMLGEMAFSQYRQLIEKVTLHPNMGCYLSHLHNQKEDLASGRIPDENYAREVMQLFSIGLYELNMDGTTKLDADHQPIETYNANDVSGLAKVLTGFSWACPMPRNRGCFLNGLNASTGESYQDRMVMPMMAYPQYHSTSNKRFLGMEIADQWIADPDGDLSGALDVISKHANVAPFISKQLIQRLVTANPSPAYIKRIATAFNKSNGDFKVVIKAILLDEEAHDINAMQTSTIFGKIREPILRMTALLRAFDAQSVTGYFLMRPTFESGFGLAQSPMRSPTVFNFFRPGYMAAGSKLAEAGLVNPEMQLVNDVTAAGYVTYMRHTLEFGTGWNGFDLKTGPIDIQFPFNLQDDHPLLALADQPTQLLDLIDKRLMYGQMSIALKDLITEAVTSFSVRPVNTETSNSDLVKKRRQRLRTALLLTVSSPEFLVQK